MSVDPLTKSYPWYTPYQFAGNMPLWAVDLDGAEPESMVTWQIEHDNKALLKNEISRKEYFDRAKARAAGGITGGGLVIASRIAIPAAAYFYTNPAALNEASAFVWGLGTDTEYPGGVGDNFARAGRNLTKEALDNALTKINLGANNIPRSMLNCPSNVCAGDNYFKTGQISSALWEIHGDHTVSQQMSQMRKIFGKEYFHDNQTAESIISKMQELGNGATGVVMGYKTYRNWLGQVKTSGHTFNVVNIDGQIYFPDFQVGKYKTTSEVNAYNSQLSFFPTSGPTESKFKARFKIFFDKLLNYETSRKYNTHSKFEKK